MRSLLLTLPILLATAPVQAETTWLVILYGKSFDQNGSVGAALEKIEVVDLETCQSEGQKWLESKTIRATSDRGFHCVTGK